MKNILKLEKELAMTNGKKRMQERLKLIKGKGGIFKIVRREEPGTDLLRLVFKNGERVQ
jgi:hypothetical protein